jgi:hypothetical protein
VAGPTRRALSAQLIAVNRHHRLPGLYRHNRALGR